MLCPLTGALQTPIVKFDHCQVSHYRRIIGVLFHPIPLSVERRLIQPQQRQLVALCMVMGTHGLIGRNDPKEGFCLVVAALCAQDERQVEESARHGGKKIFVLLKLNLRFLVETELLISQPQYIAG